MILKGFDKVSELVILILEGLVWEYFCLVSGDGVLCLLSIVLVGICVGS